MDADGRGWTWMDADGRKWTRMGANGRGWVRMGADGCGWVRMGADGCGWARMDANGRGWTWMDADGRGWTWMDVDGRGWGGAGKGGGRCGRQRALLHLPPGCWGNAGIYRWCRRVAPQPPAVNPPGSGEGGMAVCPTKGVLSMMLGATRSGGGVRCGPVVEPACHHGGRET